MTNDIRTHVRACSICQLVKPPEGPIYGELRQLPPAVLPYELVSLDTISGFAKYGNSQTFLHVVVDHATRYAWAFPSRSTSILTYTQVIKKVMQFGSPKRLLTDRAPAFTSPKFRRFLIRHNIGQLLTTSNNPQANGLSERLNATITGKLKLLRLQQPKTAWTKLLPQVLQSYNNTPHSVTGFPPSYLLLGSFPLQLSEHVQNYPKIDDARELAYQRTHKRHLREKARFDQTHRASDFEFISKCANVRSNVWTDSRGIRSILYGDLSSWIRHESTTTRQTPNSSRSSGWKPVVQRQRKRSRSHLLDNAPAHKSVLAMGKLWDLWYDFLDHPPYFPDLVPSDFKLFSHLKKFVSGKRFASDEEFE
ncbi:hypothetical protein LAZ67_X000633 [Cordylochernes scorpioides]|uniref:Integrase catalytic domain-containing protein n=1 Tax=Cordylochernes scorpioides TaxID=51811 RepID=A0ABY6LSW0_9ARAC|nr:hypothetical protein LAZ67_X000633 [Cordylochernes scorpioides]